MPIVSSIAGQILDDVYVVEVSSPPTIQGVQTGVVGLVGTFHQGVPNGIYSISDYPSAVRLLGRSDASVGGPIALQNLLRQGCGGIRVVPVFGTGAQAASVDLYDADTTPALVGTLTASQAHPQKGTMSPLLGDGPNGWSATVRASSTQNGTFDLEIDGAMTERYTGLTPATWAATVNARSALVVATQPATPSESVPAPGTFAFSGGSCGTLTTGTALDTALVGAVDGTGQATGLTLLGTLQPDAINIVFAAEASSTTVNTALATFASTNDAIAVVCASQGSTVAQTVSANTYAQDNVVFVDGWTTCYDADLGATRACAPTSLVAGMASQLGPQESWGNKTVSGTQGLLVARNNADMATLQQAGVLCLCNRIPRGGFGTRSGVASDGSQVYVRRMRYFLEYSIMNNMGWAVDALQSAAANDPLRQNVTQSIATFLNGLANPVDPSLKVIDSYNVVCNQTNNPPVQISAGILSVSVTVRLLSAARQILIAASISTSAVTTTSTVQ